MQRDQLLALIAVKLNSHQIRDYCPNGLQVEGKTDIQRIVAGVTASQALLDEAVARQADAVIVHHGYFWKNEPMQVVGMKKRRLQTLLQHDINLLAYHLPLDVHAELGNNAQLAALLGIGQVEAVQGCEPLGVLQIGQLVMPVALNAFAQQLAFKLARQPLVHVARSLTGCVAEQAVGPLIQRIAFCTGGGQSYIEQAAQAGADLFITGEVSEQTIHIADEMGIHFIAAGHHATERYGIQALAQWLASETRLQVEFIDIPNPA
jgi:dinuclear metal center YbgI/SA1388 family protein